MKNIRLLEWLGFLIVMASILANAMMRTYGRNDAIWLDVTVIAMSIGSFLTICCWLYEKRRGKHD